MVDAVSKIDENGDLEHQHNVVKDTAGIVFVGEVTSSSPAGSRTLNLL